MLPDVPEAIQIVRILCLLLLASISWAQPGNRYHVESQLSKSGLASSEIYCVAQGSNGFIWLGHNIGISRFDGLEFENFRYADTVLIRQVSAMANSETGRLYFGGTGGLFFLENGDIQNIPLPLEQSEILTIRPVGNGGLWIGGKNFTPYFLDSSFLANPTVERSRRLEPFFLEEYWHAQAGDPRTFCIETDPEGNVYFGTHTKVLRYDGQRLEAIWSDTSSNYFIRAIKAFAPDSIYWGGFKTSLRFMRPDGYDLLVDSYLHDIVSTSKGLFALHSDIYALGENEFHLEVELDGHDHLWFQRFVQDAEGTFWVGGHNDFLKIKPSPFQVYHLEDFPGVNDWFSVAGLPNGDLLLGGHRGRVYRMNDDGLSLFFPENQQIFPIAEINAVRVEKDGQIWLGSAYQGIAHYHNRQLNRYTKEQGDLADDACYFFYESPDGELWTGGDNNLTRIRSVVGDSLAFDHFTVPHLGDLPPRFYAAVADDQGALWAGSTIGIFQLKNGQLKQWLFSEPHTAHPFITHLARDHKGNVWMSTQGEGLWQCRFTDAGGLEVIKQWGRAEGLTTTWLDLHVDRWNRVWIANNTEICCLDPSREPPVFCFDQRDGWPDFSAKYMQFHERSDSTLWLVGKNALVRFSPYTLTPNDIAPEAFISKVEIMDGKESVSEYADSEPNEEGLPKNLDLPYNKNFLRFYFTTTSLQNPEKNRFRYRLIGADAEWQLAQGSRTVAYPNLAPGTYTFEVLATNNHGVWSTHPATFSFVIRPPFWQTWWAFSGYFALFSLTTFGIYQFQMRRRLEKAEVNRLQEIDGLKNRLYTNITHEFRTPLTLIKAPLEDLLISRKDDTERLTFLRMHQSAQRLLDLVDQLLDLSKLEAGSLRVVPQNGDICTFIGQIGAHFSSLADQKEIQYAIDVSPSSFPAQFDPDKLEKILTNLLSNAFKFTPKQSWIRLEAVITHAPLRLTIRVGNRGTPIPADIQDRLFGRFYQAGNIRHQGGSGIGLALVRELAELHQGQASVESDVEHGTWFSVELPVMPIEEEIIRAPLLNPSSLASEEIEIGPKEIVNTELQKSRSEAARILLVEDHEEVRAYIRQYLEEHYQLSEAADGQSGLQEAIEILPDLIVSDVMMPRMDGLAMCEAIKKDPRTNHIPIILLTAKADVESRISGLETGADDYLGKPFNSRELLARIQNLLQLRQRLKERFTQSIQVGPSMPEIDSASHRFLKKAIEVIEYNMDNAAFSVPEFAQAMLLSRTHLHRKLKSICGYNATEFMRNLRLQRAEQLLRKQTDSVSQVAYQVGFNSLPYFAKCFREKYGLSPSAFAKAQVGNRYHPKEE